MIGRTVLLILVVVVLALAGHAQDGNRNEVGLLLGIHATPGLTVPNPAFDDIEFGTGVTFQATYARHLAEHERVRLSLELPFLAAPTVKIETANGSVPLQYASLFLTPGLRVSFKPRAAVSPWLSIGAGYALFEQASELQSGAANFNTALQHTGAVQFGAGVNIPTPVRVLFPISVRVEVRDLYSGKPDYNVDTGGGLQHNLVFSGGFAVHF